MEALFAFLGVILGFFLNRISTGKLKVFINKFRKTPYKKNSIGQEVQIRATDDLNNICRIDFYYDIDLHNTSSDSRIIRNLKMISKYNDIENEYNLRDLGEREYCDYHSHYDTLSCVNMAPKSVKKLRLQLIVNEIEEEMNKERISELFDAKIYLQYFDFKGRQKIISIPKI